MADPLRYPESDAEPQPARRSSGGMSRTGPVVVAVVIALIVIVLVLHTTHVIGPGLHGGGH